MKAKLIFELKGADLPDEYRHEIDSLEHLPRTGDTMRIGDTLGTVTASHIHLKKDGSQTAHITLRDEDSDDPEFYAASARALEKCGWTPYFYKIRKSRR